MNVRHESNPHWAGSSAWSERGISEYLGREFLTNWPQNRPEYICSYHATLDSLQSLKCKCSEWSANRLQNLYLYRITLLTLRLGFVRKRRYCHGFSWQCRGGPVFTTHWTYCRYALFASLELSRIMHSTHFSLLRHGKCINPNLNSFEVSEKFLTDNECEERMADNWTVRRVEQWRGRQQSVLINGPHFLQLLCGDFNTEYCT